MAELSDAQRKRAEARKRRRGQSRDAEPEQQNDSAVSEGSEEAPDPRQAVVQAAKVAAAGAAVGAAAAAARALTHHDDDRAEPEPADEPTDGPAAEESPPEPVAEQPDAERAVPQPDRTGEEPEEREEPEEPVEGAALGDAKQAAERAREQLEALLGRPIESVSSLERTHDGWVLNFEVLELSRVPDTTDVLASYEMELDDHLNLRRYQQVRRYHRAEAGRGEES
jgi:hypothetical protein